MYEISKNFSVYQHGSVMDESFVDNDDPVDDVDEMVSDVSTH